MQSLRYKGMTDKEFVSMLVSRLVIDEPLTPDMRAALLDLLMRADDWLQDVKEEAHPAQMELNF